jgi:uncharacterized Tic20 family protein
MTKMPESQERNLGMACHLVALAGFVIPFGNIIGPLILWLVKKEESEFVDDQGKESLNFQISITIYLCVAALLVIIVIGIPLLIGLGIFSLVMIVVAAVKASSGEKYRYPLTLRLVK